MGAHDFEYNKVPLLVEKQGKQYFDVCCPETSSCAIKLLLLRCKLVIPQCMCISFIRIERGLDGSHDF